MTDHLGNTRTTFSDKDGNGQIAGLEWMETMLTDPTGLCPECPDDAEAGDFYVWADDFFFYDGQEWAAYLPDVTVTASSSNNGEHDDYWGVWDMEDMYGSEGYYGDYYNQNGLVHEYDALMV